MLVHLRYANTGGVSLLNTLPFSQDGRLFAHNGVVGHLERIEARLGANRAMVMGDTDSERFFALITLAIREAGGDVRAGITAAVREVVDQYELYSLNFPLGAVGHIWAFRYPEHNPLQLDVTQYVARPPERSKTAPVEKLHASLARNAISAATSSGWPRRFIGIRSTM